MHVNAQRAVAQNARIDIVNACIDKQTDMALVIGLARQNWLPRQRRWRHWCVPPARPRPLHLRRLVRRMLGTNTTRVGARPF